MNIKFVRNPLKSNIFMAVNRIYYFGKNKNLFPFQAQPAFLR